MNTEDIANFTKTEALEALKKITNLKNALEKKLQEPDVLKLEYPSGQCWIIGGFTPSSARESFPIKQNLLSNGCYRLTSENALNASRRRTNANIIEAWAEKLEPNWKPNALDKEQEKCSITWNNIRQKFEVEVKYTDRIIGVPVMSLDTAHRIKRMLNNKEITLHRNGEENES